MAADAVLRILDKYLEEAGASRGSLSNGDDIKSSACLFCEPCRLPEFAGWDTQYVRDTCRIRSSNEAVKVLGAMAGDALGRQN